MIHCKYIRRVNSKEGELFKLMKELYKHKDVWLQIDHELGLGLESFLTMPGMSKQCPRHKRPKGFKLGHSTVICPRGI